MRTPRDVTTTTEPANLLEFKPLERNLGKLQISLTALLLRSQQDYASVTSRRMAAQICKSLIGRH
jgi:hypothetical protein